MTDVHPTLEAVAQAICEADTRPDGSYGFDAWRDYLPEARAALNALANDGHLPDRFIRSQWLREIAAERKTVEDVLSEHRNTGLVTDRDEGYRFRCECGNRYDTLSHHTHHVAEILREAGLLREEE